MFSVRTDRMVDCCVQLERQTAEMSQLNIELDAVIRSLSSLSGMDEVIAGLKTEKSRMETEGEILSQMMRGLDRIELDYMNCENRICDNGEQSVIRYARRDIGTSDLSGVSDALEDISFM